MLDKNKVNKFLLEELRYSLDYRVLLLEQLVEGQPVIKEWGRNNVKLFRLLHTLGKRLPDIGLVETIMEDYKDSNKWGWGPDGY